jgi:glycosyltransferase involved in cell wall biosynthesis
MSTSPPTISVLCLVKNEERWIWFTLMAALPHVKEILIGDTGSTDGTVRAIESIDNSKLVFTNYGPSSNTDFTRFRQEQIERATGDWLMILDGDELWTESGWHELQAALTAAKPRQDLVLTRFYNYIGDIYHYQHDRFSGYRWRDIQGNITLRLFRASIPGIHCGGPYGIEGYYDGDDTDIMMASNYDTAIVLQNRYMHASYLVRSNTLWGDWVIPYRRGKFLNVLGVETFPVNQEQPKSFTLNYPSWILSPLSRRSAFYFVTFSFLSQLARVIYLLKRRLTSHV